VKATVVVVVILVAAGGIGWATGWFSHAPEGILGWLAPPCPPTVGLNGSGSTFVAPLMQTWTHAYEGGAESRERGCDVVQVAYNASGAGTGLGELISGGTDFVATEEPLNASAAASLPAPTLTLPVALGAVAVAYDLPGVPAGLNLTGAILAAIYLGTITAWNDSAIVAINPGVALPSDVPISVIHGAPGSSTNYVFTGFLSASNATWDDQVGQGATVVWPTGISASGDAGAVSVLQGTTGGIAFLGFAYAQDSNLTCAKIQNPADVFVAPSVTSIYAAATAYGESLPLGNQSWQNVSLLDQSGNDSYPLTTFTYVVCYANLGQADRGTLTQNTAAWLASFLYWMSAAGQNYGAALGYPPLSSHVITTNEQIVELLTYDGLPALGDVDYDGD
jgi:phosphate ABC transporter phosphate-binding protein